MTTPVPLPQYDDDDWMDWAGFIQAVATQVLNLASVATTGQFSDLLGVPNFGEFVFNLGGTDPARPSTTRTVVWIVPDANRPATNGTTNGGSYASVPNVDLVFTF